MARVTKDILLSALTPPDPEVLRLLEESDEVTERILAATFDQIAAVGWRRSTMEDIAKRAGLGRATVYRKFPNKNELTTELLRVELRKYVDGRCKYLAASALVNGDQATMADRMAESAAYTVEFLRDHPLLRRLVETEPETILPALTTEGSSIIEPFREFSAALWKSEFFGDAPISPQALQHLRTVAELHLRITLSLVLTPQSVIDLDSPGQASVFVRRYLAPMLDADFEA